MRFAPRANISRRSTPRRLARPRSVTPKFIARSDPAAQWTGAHKCHACFAYAHCNALGFGFGCRSVSRPAGGGRRRGDNRQSSKSTKRRSYERSTSKMGWRAAPSGRDRTGLSYA